MFNPYFSTPKVIQARGGAGTLAVTWRQGLTLITPVHFSAEPEHVWCGI